MKIVTAAQMIDLDRRTIKSGIPEKRLIQQAGKAAAGWIIMHYPRTRKILILAGKGNNGADALVVGRLLKKARYQVTICDLGKKFIIPPASSNTLVIDGIFGTGLNRPVKEPYLSLIKSFRKFETISLDLPSGLHADTGKRLGTSFRAAHTLTFGFPKLGLVQEHAADDVGRLHVFDVGFPEHLGRQIQSPYQLITPEDVAPYFPSRAKNSYKGTFGHVLVIGGSTGFAGAPALAARAALRTGAGLVSLVVPKSIYPIAAKLAGAEVMVHPVDDGGKGCFNAKLLGKIKNLINAATAVVLGPGIGRNLQTQKFIKNCIQTIPRPIILDADGLNNISDQPSILRKAKWKMVITPHPGEMGRLAKLTTKEVQQNRFKVAGDFSKKQDVVVVLKGARTVVAHPSRFRGFNFSVNALAGNPGMATAGCGDVLSGIIGALLARGLSSSEAAVAGVFLHARAGDLVMPETGGGIAGDLIQILPDAIHYLKRV